MNPTHWPRAALTERDLAAIDATHWRRFPKATVTAIAQAWNGGLCTMRIATDLKCRPGSVRILIGRLTQRGVAMRLRDEMPFPLIEDAPFPVAVRKVLNDHQMARLQRLADFDPVLRRCAERASQDRRRFA